VVSVEVDFGFLEAEVDFGFLEAEDEGFVEVVF